MNIEEKIEIIKGIYDNLNIENYHLENERDEEIKADFIWIPEQKGIGGVIVADDGSYLFCQSSHDYEYWKAEFIKGTRTK